MHIAITPAICTNIMILTSGAFEPVVISYCQVVATLITIAILLNLNWNIIRAAFGVNYVNNHRTVTLRANIHSGRDTATSGLVTIVVILDVVCNMACISGAMWNSI